MRKLQCVFLATIISPFKQDIAARLIISPENKRRPPLFFIFVLAQNLVLSVLPHQIAVLIVRILFLFFRRWNRLLHAARSANGNRERRDILGDNRSGSNCWALADSHAGKDNHITSYPAVVFDKDRMAELNELATRKNASIMASSDDTNSGANLYTVPNNNQAGV